VIFTKTEIDEETIEYKLNGEYLIVATHDTDGWSGMERIDNLIKTIAKKLGASIHTDEHE
jgi:hypothetical protein